MKKDIIKQFNEEFPNEESGYLNSKEEYVHLFNPAVDARDIKLFIDKTLSSQREQIISILDEMDTSYDGDVEKAMVCWTTITEAISKIKEL